MLAFNDVLVKASNRLLVNQPQLSVGNTSTFLGVMVPFLQCDADTNQLYDNSKLDLSLLTASGLALANRAQDFNAFPFLGLPATVNVVFFVQVAPPVGAPYTIPANTIVGTFGNSLTQPVVNFLTQNAVTITNPSVASVPVPCVCTQNGVIGNVVASAGPTSGVVVSNLPTGVGIQVSNALSVAGVSNPGGAGIGGQDPSTDAQLRQLAVANTQQQNTNSIVATKVLAVTVPGTANTQAFDFFLFDPGSGSSRFVYYFWCCADGSMPGLVSSTPTNSGSPDNGQASSANYLANPVFTPGSLAAQIDLTVRSWLGATVLPRLGCGLLTNTTSSFSAITLTTIPITYSSPALATVIGPLIQTAVVAYVQSLKHGQPLLPSSLYGYVQSQVGGLLTGFNVGTGYTSIGATIPASSTVTPTQILRCTGTPSSVVQLTRI